MAPRAAMTTASRAGASDSEDDLAQLNTKRADAKFEVDRATSKMAKSKTTKPVVRRVSAGKTTTAKRKAAPKRTALQDRTNIQAGSDTEEVDAFDDDMDMDAAKPQAKRAKLTTATRKNATATEAEPRSAKPATGAKRGRPGKRAQAVVAAEPLAVIPESQPEPEQMEDVEQSIEVDPEYGDDEQHRASSRQAQRYVTRPATNSIQPLLPRASSRATPVPVAYLPQRERSGSAVAGDRRGGDPELRRRLNEMTKKYEDLHVKYESLEAIGRGEAESNFDKLKRASDQKARDAHELIAALKKELAELRKSSSSVGSETAGLNKQVAALTESSEKAAAERDELRSKLQASQNDHKALEAKLVATRQQMANGVHDAKAAAQTSHRNAPPAMNASEAQRDAKMKENLYSDLTGLIVRNVKRQEGEDIYDCIQTGRNGTLHFHLTIANDASTPHPKTPSGLSYEESEFAYEPLLDEGRDRDLLNLLPDYLTEEICFPRQHAQKFYTRILDSMSKKIELEDE